MKAKRLTAMLLAALMVFSMLTSLVSCKPESGDENQTSAADTTTESGSETQGGSDAEDKTFTLFEGGKWNISIVRHRKLSNLEESASISLRSDLASTVGGVRLEFENDSLKSGESYDPEPMQFYFGYTDHPEMKEFFPTVGLGEAAVKVVGNKILLAANTYEGYDRLTYHLTSLFKEKLVDGKIVVSASELNKVIVVDKVLNTMPVPQGLALEGGVDCEFNQSLFIYNDATPEAFKEYIKKFEGFKQEQLVESEGNHFATFTKDGHLYNVSYSKGDNKLRIIMNKNTEATEYFTQPTAVDQKTTPMIIMHGLASVGNTDNQNGMCILIRLSDGRFIVFDGGFSRQNDADKLYHLLKKYKPEGMAKPVIAAWVITHAHGDHDGTFRSAFVNSYRLVVDIQSVIFNPPSIGINKSSNDAGTSIEGAQYKTLVTMTQGITGCEWIRAHVGDKYYIGDAEIDVLYSVDHFYPATFTYYNTCSLILSIKIAGQRIIMTGDAANASFGKAVKMFGDSLKCDIVQVAHHGYTTGVSDDLATSIMQAYRYMSPSLVLWPIGPYGYDSVKNRVYNMTLVNLSSVKQVIVAGTEDHIIDLPYKAK